MLQILTNEISSESCVYMFIFSILIFSLGVFLGTIVTFIIHKKNNDIKGTLRIDRSDPDRPFLFLELLEPIDNVISEKHVTFEVLDKNYISTQK